MDIADRKAVDLRRRLTSADRLSERAMAEALFNLKTPAFRSKASLFAVTPADHFLGRRVAFFFTSVRRFPAVAIQSGCEY